MGELADILNNLRQPTYTLKPIVLKLLLQKSHFINKNNQDEPLFWESIAEVLWTHLITGFPKFEDQLLCSTCFYNILKFHYNQSLLLNKILDFIENYYKQKSNRSGPDYINTDRLLSLAYGLFQSSFLTDLEKENPIVTSILISSLEILILMAYEYSCRTYIVFKLINYYQKLENTVYFSKVFTKSKQQTLLDVIIHNWENPITGVRDLNKCIFGYIWNFLDSQFSHEIFTKIIGLPWNKAKYLMVSEIISKYQGPVVNLCSENPDLIEGLINTLYGTGLVSAGTDMYSAILSKLNCENEWSKLFMCYILNLLQGKSMTALDNFSNYWCLMTFKKFPALFHIIIMDIPIKGCFETTYSAISLIKQANKLGILNKVYSNTFDSSSVNDLLVACLSNSDTHLRVLAFEVICTLHYTKMPNEWECSQVYKFLEENINTDTTVLRISMLNNLRLFLNKIHNAFINNVKKRNDYKIDQTLLIFCSNIQSLIKSSLDFKNANYQRKITSIKICDMIWTCFTNIQRKKDVDNSQNNQLINALRNGNVWIFNNEEFVKKLLKTLQDPADDIRQSVINILLTHYAYIFKQSETFDMLAEDSFNCMSSKFFYEISSGHSILWLLTSLLLKNDGKSVRFKNVDTLFSYVLQILFKEYKDHKNIVQSIENGIQIHALMNALITIMDVLIKNSYPIQSILIESQINELLVIIENISTQFACDEDSTFSSDFLKMDHMVEDIIRKSGYDINNFDKTKISGLHQIVLNCMWLNVKASCDMSTMLIRCLSNDCYNEHCQKSLQIITKVLEISRHKGAIEAAGNALGVAVEHLTMLPSETSLSKLPYNFLKCKLKEMTEETSKMASVTRRGAGLSIMIHRIVSSDKNKGKPLFHYFMTTLLNKCNNVEPEHSTGTTIHETGIERDLPEAIYIHFLTRVVTDSSLHPDIMYYAEVLGEIAFRNLNSEHWQIRNAALQLYGALVPKLLGQRKSCGNYAQSIATVACDEFRMHSPKLWCYINDQLKLASDDIHVHSNLVPILNLLAHMAKKYNFHSNTDDSDHCNIEFLKILMKLLKSPIYTVRYLTSKAIYLNYSIDSVIKQLDFKNINIPENLFHGYLLLTSMYYTNVHNKIENREFGLSKKYFTEIMTIRKHSYLCRMLYDELFLILDQNHAIENVKKLIEELQAGIHTPGISSWVNFILKKYIEVSSWSMIPEILKVILSDKGHRVYCEFLLQRINLEKTVPTDVSHQIIDILLECNIKFDSNVLWEILHKLSTQVDLSKCVYVKTVGVYLNENNYFVPYKIRDMLPFACNIAKYIKISSFTLQLTDKISQMANLETMDTDKRFIVVKAINEFASTFINLDDKSKINLLKAVIILLQDEDENIRNKITLFVKILLQEQHVLQPYVCLRKIMDYKYLTSLFEHPKESKCLLINTLQKLITDYDIKSCNKSDCYNPFANDAKNIYFESDVLKNLIEDFETVSE